MNKKKHFNRFKDQEYNNTMNNHSLLTKRKFLFNEV